MENFHAFLYSGLVQPVANWESTRELPRGMGATPGRGGGKRYSRLPGHCGVIAQRVRVRGPLYIYHHGAPFDGKNTILSTPRVLEFPTPRVLDFPPPSPTGHQGALIVTRDTSAATISLGKGSGNPTNASGSGTGRSTAKRRTESCIFFGVILSYFFLRARLPIRLVKRFWWGN